MPKSLSKTDLLRYGTVYPPLFKKLNLTVYLKTKWKSICWNMMILMFEVSMCSMELTLKVLYGPLAALSYKLCNTPSPFVYHPYAFLLFFAHPDFDLTQTISVHQWQLFEYISDLTQWGIRLCFLSAWTYHLHSWLSLSIVFFLVKYFNN